MNKINSFFIIAGTAVLLLGGCGTAIDNLNTYKPDLLERAEYIPSKKELEGKRSKIIIMDVDNAGFSVAEHANLGNALRRMLENEIGRAQVVDILDRSVSAKLDQEIKLAEMNGVLLDDNALLDVADYAVAAELKNASFTSRFVKRYSWVDKKGYVHVIPAHYVYTAEVDGQIKIYELPSLKIKKIISFSDNKQRSEDSKFLGRRVYLDSGLVNKAGEDAIHAVRVVLKNFFAPKGYLIDSRVRSNDRIIKVSLGKQDGLREGDRLKIITKKESVNQLMQTSEVEHHTIGRATVSDKIQNKTAWAHLDDVIPGERIRLGDEVKVIYKRGFLDYMNDAGRIANTLSK